MLPGDVNWANWSGLFTDARLWQAPVHEVLSRSGLRPLRIETGFPGTTAAFIAQVVRLDPGGSPLEVPGGRVVVKFYPPMTHRDYATEVEVRSALRPVPGIRPYVPSLLKADILHDAIDWPYTIEEFMPGRAARDVWCDLPSAAKQDVARRVEARDIRTFEDLAGVLCPAAFAQGRA